MNAKGLDDLAARLRRILPPEVDNARNDLHKNFKALLSSGLNRMDLVTREEFDVQSAVLARTREKLTALEKRVAALERELDARANTDANS